MITFEPSRERHVLDVAVRMRQCDKDELWAAGQPAPYQVLLRSIEMPGEHYTAFKDGVPIAMFGFSDLHGNQTVGVPWMLGTDDLEDVAMTVLRQSKKHCEAAKKRFDLMLNYVDARNTTSIKWLKWLGFTIKDAEPYGPFGSPFHYFEYRKPEHV